ncbi:hypothetical protein RND71_028150 [Anisodus tanguticus]|uniref:Ribosome maturation factor RimP N-terminal domain-containing protein n=1 Tax=Anisodus tanguticus TaxID=243964 RepID=A0AAE1RKK4_9SOLA|nr:hypothetical protein RND71_028150 [Anisodus tanguticus]
MNLMRGWHLRSANFGLLPISMDCSSSRISCRTHGFSFPFSFSPDSLSSTPSPRMVCGCVKKRNPNSEPLLNPQVSLDEFIVEDFEYEDDDDEFFDEYFEEDSELYVGDGSGGGGISLAGTSWDKKSLELVEEVALSFNGELGIYAFKTLKNGNIQVRVERLTNKSGSPSLMDIEAFSSRYREKLDEAELAGSIPNNIYLEVSSPGVERLFGFLKILTGSRTVLYVRANRERAGKGRPLSKKQREWRLETPFTSLRLIRLYSEM